MINLTDRRESYYSIYQMKKKFQVKEDRLIGVKKKPIYLFKFKKKVSINPLDPAVRNINILNAVNH